MSSDEEQEYFSDGLTDIRDEVEFRLFLDGIPKTKMECAPRSRPSDDPLLTYPKIDFDRYMLLVVFSYARDSFLDLNIAEVEGHNAGLVSVESFTVDTLQAVELVYKREDGMGYAYTGMILISVHGQVWVVVVASRECGMTGTREAVVTAELAKQGILEIEEYEKPGESEQMGRVKGWFRDPYDPEFPGIVLMSLSDDEKYDAQFPQHPLSRLRGYLKNLRASIRPQANQITSPQDHDSC